MKKWSAFACPPAAFLLIAWGIFFQPHSRLSTYLPILILFVMLLGIYLIMTDRSLPAWPGRLLFCAGYLGYILLLSAAGGFIAGLLGGMFHHP